MWRRMVWRTAIYIIGLVTLTPIVGWSAIPQNIDPVAAARGIKVYDKYGCFVCHGLNGTGGVRNSNSVNNEQVGRLTKVSENFTAEELKEKVRNGVTASRRKDPKGPLPPLTMPAYEGMISEEDLDDLTVYQLSLSSSPVGVSSERPAVPAFMLGEGNCKVCHGQVARQFEQNSHFAHRLDGTIPATAGTADSDHTPDAAQVCATCHGNGDQHAQDPSNPKTLLRFNNLKSATPAEKNKACLTCHENGARFAWRGSVHDSKDMNCATCHSIHNPTSDNNMLAKANTMETCFQCHKLQKAQIQRTSHMPIREGKLDCSSCHNPHGTTTEKLLTTNSVNENCYQCHTEKRGPFLWEHAPVAENCMNCHTPHGSNHASLLKMERPRLCQRCHIESRHPTTPQLAASRFVFDRSCVNCHTQIHGSNHPSGVRFLR